MKTEMTKRAMAVGASVWLLVLAGASAQQPDDSTSPAPASTNSPYEAYEAGLYDVALEKFIDRQVERPEDEELKLNIGSVHYQRKDYDNAKTSYAQAAGSGDPLVRAEALYNLGNTSYREGKLQEAIDFYMESLDLNPDDEDAKFNLEFVREEVRRRQEQQQERQENQDQQQDQEEQNQDQQDQGQQDDQQQGEGENEDQQNQQSGDSGQQDGDGDGLPDEVEKMGKNPTDPANPDSDGDGRTDGEEDQNQNGQVDPGESDPNKPDGTPQQQAGDPSEGGEGSLTPQEAERYLQALEERQPDKARRGKKAKVVRTEKDW